MSNNKRREQVTVPMPAELRAFIEREAERQDRTVAGQIRHLVAEAARQSENQQEQAA
jgi:hypothetical protein